MGLKQIADTVWVQELDLGIFDIRGTLVLGQQRALVWDTLSHPKDMQAYLPVIGDREIVVVYSHADWDHIWGTAGLQPPPAAIVSHALCAARFETDVPVALAKKQAAEPGKWDEVQLIPPSINVEGKFTIDLGGVRVEFHHLPGHTPDCLVAFLPEQGIALMGDTIETPFPVVPPNSPLSEWIEQLQEWASNPVVERVIPCHGPMGNRELIAQTIHYLECLRDGKAIDVGEDLSDFYRDTHQRNLAWQG